MPTKNYRYETTPESVAVDASTVFEAVSELKFVSSEGGTGGTHEQGEAYAFTEADIVLPAPLLGL